ncbi:MAG: hypothetical protein ABJO30_04175 [Hyphomicrobiales bacterium]
MVTTIYLSTKFLIKPRHQNLMGCEAMGAFDDVHFNEQLRIDPDKARELIIKRLAERNINEALADALINAIEHKWIVFKKSKLGRPSEITGELMDFMLSNVDDHKINVAADARERFNVSRATALAALAAAREYQRSNSEESRNG